VATDSQTYRLAPPRPSSGHPALDQHAVQFDERDDFLLEGNPDERLRAVADLQQRVAALEADVATKG